MELRQGVADLETCLPMLFSAGVNTGRLSLEPFVAVTATNPAKLFGLYPRKGTVNVGADADLVVWDPAETRTIDGTRMHSRSDFSPYDGTRVTGWPRFTLSRGEVVAEGAKVLADTGRGELVTRGPHQPL
jgi:dihydropyrimidinase